MNTARALRPEVAALARALQVVLDYDTFATKDDEEIAAALWERLEADPDFVAGMEKARQERAAGPFTPFRGARR